MAVTLLPPNHHCDYLQVKGFDQAWQGSRDRLGVLQPQGYTRIGPAIRHATHLIGREPSKQKWILLLSDGKPNDYDRYEGSYGIRDVRQAIREASRQNIHVNALAIESRACYYLPAMLGHGRYRILPRPGLLPAALSEFYSKLM